MARSLLCFVAACAPLACGDAGGTGFSGGSRPEGAAPPAAGPAKAADAKAALPGPAPVPPGAAVPSPHPVAPPPPPPPQDVPATSSLFWDLPCAKAPVATMPADPAAAVISGPGDFLLARSAPAIKLEIAGKLCDSAREARDVVFVIDESESMRNFFNLGNDPLRAGSCGRADAVTAVVKALPADARVAFVTFDDAVKQDSAAFLAPAAFLAKYATADVFCARGGGTDYQVALARALALLGQARPAAAKEVYLLSDGAPDSMAVSGLAEGEKIRALGTLATVMLNGADPTLLRDELASRDGNDVAYYVTVDDVSMLAASLAGLSSVHVVSATLRYGPLGQPAAQTAAAAAFDLTGMTLSPALDPVGFTAELETLDSRNVKTVTMGRLLWRP